MRTIGVSFGLMMWVALACAQPFTYQGNLRDGGLPANGAYDFRFRLFTAFSGGTQMGGDQFANALTVQNGLFTTSVDFGAVWDGTDRYLQIAVRPSTSTGAYTILYPRVKINSTPYAIRAGSANPIGPTGGDLAGTYPNPTVARLQGRSVTSTVPSNGQVLKWDGSAWAPAADNGLILPYSGNADVPVGAVFSITNTADNGINYGVEGRSNSTSGTGVFGLAPANSGFTNGGYFQSNSTNGRGVQGVATATTGTTYGGSFLSDSTSGYGVFGSASATSGSNFGVVGSSRSPSGIGVSGYVTALSGAAWGVRGETFSSNSASYGVIGLESLNSPGHAVFASGSLAASGTKSFQIDHPLSPETHYLNHFCTESPEPMNAYSGVITLDARGEAWVQLPDYFEAINRDPRYTLTPIGAPMPNLHVAVKINVNRFKIAGGAPGKEVSWRVDAIRNDLYVKHYGFQTVQEKEKEFRGKYLHPALFGQPKEQGIHYRPGPEHVKP